QPGWLNKRVEVLGTEGMIDCVVGNYFRILTRKAADVSAPAEFQDEEVGVDGWNRATIRFVEDLVRVLRAGPEKASHRNRAQTSHPSFEVIQALALSALEGRIVELPLPREGRDPLGELLAAHSPATHPS